MLSFPGGWESILADQRSLPYFGKLAAFVEEERAKGPVFPPAEDVFHALALTPLEEVRVLLLGQDPYHDDGQAHGLCFSVRRGVKPPPSLKNIFKELATDIGCPIPKHGCLDHWAQQGVLLLNTVLTVRAHEAASHQKRGWESFTDAIIQKVNDQPKAVVFVLWGGHAQKKIPLIDTARHTIIASAHPSPLSAKNGFFGSKPFSQVNAALQAKGRGVIDWCIPDE